MNLLISVLILQLLLRQVLTDLACLKTEKCSCKKHIDKEEIEVTCNSSKVKANLMESVVETYCDSEQIQWEQYFNQINVTKFRSFDCPLGTGIHHRFSVIGINDVEEMKLVRMKLNGSLESFYLSSLKNMVQLDISDTKTMLKLTNESFEGTPYLKRLYLRRNLIKELPRGVFKNLIYLEVLDLGNNEISIIDNDLFDGISLKGLVMDSNHLTTWSLNIPSLKHLEVSNNKLNSIKVENLHNLVDISLNKNTLVTMPDQPFKNTSLVMIKFNYGSFTTLPKRFLFGLDQLKIVRIKDIHLEVVPEDMIWNSHNVTELCLASNNLKELPIMFFRDSGNIKILDLSRNRLEKINYDLLRPLKKLETLDLSYNLLVRINHFSFSDNLVNLYLENNNISVIEREALNVPKLKFLKLAHNKISKLSSDYLFIFNYLNEVEDVDLSYNNISDIDEGWINLVRLKRVNLANNNFSVFYLSVIQFFKEGVELILNSNPLEEIELSGLEMFVAEQQPSTFIENNDYLSKRTRKISLSGNKLICDCRNYNFARYVRKQIEIPTVYEYLEIKQNFNCSDGKIFKNVKLDSLTCDWSLLEDPDKIDCPDHCVCTYRPDDKSALMNCSNKNLKISPTKIISSNITNYTDVILKNNAIVELPNYKSSNIRKLDVGNNSLSTINFTQLPENLVELNLEHNNLKQVDDENIDSILSNLGHLNMSGNPWTCEGKNTFNFVRRFSEKIMDLNITKCPDSSMLIDKLKEEENKDFQQFKFRVVAVSLVIFILLLFLFWALFNGYKTEIKVWLYSHNITWSISEESLDHNKIYDAFISFSHGDLDFIENELVPGLEGGSPSFKLCLHYRDWTIGDYIPYQIARSVDESRRTVIVLSQNFLESIWAGTEFRTAYVSALKEGRSRIIVILYGNVSTDNLDPDLKEYLSMNTYIEWGDRWFWKKLKYALPHKQEKKIKTEPIIPDKLNPLQLKFAN